LREAKCETLVEHLFKPSEFHLQRQGCGASRSATPRAPSAATLQLTLKRTKTRDLMRIKNVNDAGQKFK